MNPALFLPLKGIHGGVSSPLSLPASGIAAGLGGGVGGSTGSGGSFALPPPPIISGAPTDHAGGIDLGYAPALLQHPAPREFNEAASQTWVRGISEVVNRILSGKMNVTVDVILTPNASATTVIDSRLSSTTTISFCPLTANAAAELAAGTLWIGERRTGVVVINHANNAQTDRHFDCTIIG